MSVTDTTETDAIAIRANQVLCMREYVDAEFARKIERERDEIEHKLEICMAANRDVKRIAMERNALADALRVRLTGVCKKCGYLQDMENHWENCQCYETEAKLLNC